MRRTSSDPRPGPVGPDRLSPPPRSCRRSTGATASGASRSERTSVMPPTDSTESPFAPGAPKTTLESTASPPFTNTSTDDASTMTSRVTTPSRSGGRRGAHGAVGVGHRRGGGIRVAGDERDARGEVEADGRERAVALLDAEAHLGRGIVRVGRDLDAQAVGVAPGWGSGVLAASVTRTALDASRPRPRARRAPSTGVDTSVGRSSTVRERELAHDRVGAAVPVVGGQVAGIGPVVEPADRVARGEPLGLGQARVVPGDGRVEVGAVVEPRGLGGLRR